MTHRKPTSTSILNLVFSLLMVFMAQTAMAQKKLRKPLIVEPDTTAWLNGFAVSADLVGPLQFSLGDYGQYEAALRVNLKDRYFPVVELGWGKADHADDVTHISYKTNAPYGRVGCDFNMMRDKHDQYRFYVGGRYAYSSFKFDVEHPGVADPVWGGNAVYGGHDVKAHYHWVEAVAGVDATIWGPLHLGWSVRYKRRIAYDNGPMGNVWYVPGYGKGGGTRLGGTFNVIIDI